MRILILSVYFTLTQSALVVPTLPQSTIIKANNERKIFTAQNDNLASANALMMDQYSNVGDVYSGRSLAEEALIQEDANQKLLGINGGSKKGFKKITTNKSNGKKTILTQNNIGNNAYDSEMIKNDGRGLIKDKLLSLATMNGIDPKITETIIAKTGNEENINGFKEMVQNFDLGNVKDNLKQSAKEYLEDFGTSGSDINCANAIVAKLTPELKSDFTNDIVNGGSIKETVIVKDNLPLTSIWDDKKILTEENVNNLVMNVGQKASDLSSSFKEYSNGIKLQDSDVIDRLGEKLTNIVTEKKFDDFITEIKNSKYRPLINEELILDGMLKDKIPAMKSHLKNFKQDLLAKKLDADKIKNKLKNRKELDKLYKNIKNKGVSIDSYLKDNYPVIKNKIGQHLKPIHSLVSKEKQIEYHKKLKEFKDINIPRYNKFLRKKYKDINLHEKIPELKSDIRKYIDGSKQLAISEMDKIKLKEKLGDLMMYKELYKKDFIDALYNSNLLDYYAPFVENGYQFINDNYRLNGKIPAIKYKVDKLINDLKSNSDESDESNEISDEIIYKRPHIKKVKKPKLHFEKHRYMDKIYSDEISPKYKEVIMNGGYESLIPTTHHNGLFDYYPDSLEFHPLVKTPKKYKAVAPSSYPYDIEEYPFINYEPYDEILGYDLPHSMKRIKNYKPKFVKENSLGLKNYLKPEYASSKYQVGAEPLLYDTEDLDEEKLTLDSLKAIKKYKSKKAKQELNKRKKMLNAHLTSDYYDRMYGDDEFQYDLIPAKKKYAKHHRHNGHSSSSLLDKMKKNRNHMIIKNSNDDFYQKNLSKIKHDSNNVKLSDTYNAIKRKASKLKENVEEKYDDSALSEKVKEGFLHHDNTLSAKEILANNENNGKSVSSTSNIATHINDEKLDDGKKYKQYTITTRRKKNGGKKASNQIPTNSKEVVLVENPSR